MIAARRIILTALAVVVMGAAALAQNESFFVGVGYGQGMDLEGFEKNAQVLRASVFKRGTEFGVLQGEFGIMDATGFFEGKSKYTVIFTGKTRGGNNNFTSSFGTAYVMEKTTIQFHDTAVIRVGTASLDHSDAGTSKHNVWAIYAAAKYHKDRYMLALEYFHFLDTAQADGLLTLTFNLALTNK